MSTRHEVTTETFLRNFKTINKEDLIKGRIDVVVIPIPEGGEIIVQCNKQKGNKTAIINALEKSPKKLNIQKTSNLEKC